MDHEDRTSHPRRLRLMPQARSGHGASIASPSAAGAVVSATEMVMRACEGLQLAYTAFDGDHFQLCGHMRRYVMARGLVPANPESILGYKDVVTTYSDKREVLRDDPSILTGCDELWVFTEQPPTPRGIVELAEGVAVELLFFLSQMPHRCVRFVSPLALLGRELPEPALFRSSYDEVLAAMPHGQAASLIEFLKTAGPLRPLVYYIHDPLDFKYAGWLRADAYQQHAAPLVPGLALELAEVEAAVAAPLDRYLTLALVSWAKLSCTRGAMRASCRRLRPCGSPSFVANVLESVFERRKGSGSVEARSWQQFAIPKARTRMSWGLTEKERRPRG